MTLKNEKRNMIFAGLVIGVIASLLVLFGNPKNMGFCVACFLRDTAGALGLHSAEAVQYIRPEIIGLVLRQLFHGACQEGIFSARRQRAGDPLCARHVRDDRKPDVPRLPVPHDPADSRAATSTRFWAWPALPAASWSACSSSIRATPSSGAMRSRRRRAACSLS